MLVFNEFGQRFSTSRQVPEGGLAIPLSRIDTIQSNRSIFSLQVAGTLAGRTTLQTFGGGVHALGIEKHRSRETGVEHTDAVEVHGFGQHPDGDVIVFRGHPCTGDCNLDGEVALHEVITRVGIGGGSIPFARCLRADRDGDAEIAIDEMVSSVASSIHGCPAIATPPVPTPTARPSVTPAPTRASDGPEITHLGLATADDIPLSPHATDDGPAGVRPSVRPGIHAGDRGAARTGRGKYRAQHLLRGGRGTGSSGSRLARSRRRRSGGLRGGREDGGVAATADLDFAGGRRPLRR